MHKKYSRYAFYSTTLFELMTSVYFIFHLNYIKTCFGACCVNSPFEKVYSDILDKQCLDQDPTNKHFSNFYVAARRYLLSFG